MPETPLSSNVDGISASRASCSHAQSGPYWAELLGLRGIAIIIVVNGHLLQRISRFYDGNYQLNYLEKELLSVFATPFSGCCIFFCVSGYALYGYIVHRQPCVDFGSIASYISRRFIRLYPPYAFVLVSTYIFISTTGYTPVGANNFNANPESLLLSFVSSLSLIHDLVFGTFPRLFPPGWFIESQIQFYIFAPFIWRAYSSIISYRKRLFGGIAVLVASYILSLIVNSAPRNLQYSIADFLPYFWLGAMIAECHHTLGIRRHGILRKWSPFSWCALVAFIMAGESALSTGLQLSLRLVCLTFIVGLAFIDGTSFQNFLLQKWLRSLGIILFSIYLVHLQTLQIIISLIMKDLNSVSAPILFVICLVVGNATVLAASTSFYGLVERPCSNISKRFRSKYAQ